MSCNWLLMPDVILDRLPGQCGSVSLHQGIEPVPTTTLRQMRKGSSDDKIQSFLKRSILHRNILSSCCYFSLIDCNCQSTTVCLQKKWMDMTTTVTPVPSVVRSYCTVCSTGRDKAWVKANKVKGLEIVLWCNLNLLFSLWCKWKLNFEATIHFVVI